MKCKNDITRNYSGNEPSPKGLGYCAHAEKTYTIMEGKNYKMWYVDIMNNIKRWKLLTIPKEFIKTLKNINTKIKLKRNKNWSKNLDTENINIKKISLGKNYNDILIHHDGPPNIYQDQAVIDYIKKITKYKFYFSEQGMQKKKIAHMELKDSDIIKIIKSYK